MQTFQIKPLHYPDKRRLQSFRKFELSWFTEILMNLHGRNFGGQV